jgi:hypothetical protein
VACVSYIGIIGYPDPKVKSITPIPAEYPEKDAKVRMYRLFWPIYFEKSGEIDLKLTVFGRIVEGKEGFPSAID